MTETLAALEPWATRAHIVREVCSRAAWLPHRPRPAHTILCERRQSDLLICLRVRAQIKAEAEKAGVSMADAARHTSVGADGAAGGQLLGASRQELVKYISHQEHLLSNIESLSGINIDQIKHEHEHEHHFVHSERTEHYDNIFAKAAQEDDDPDAFASQAGTDSGDAAARAWNLVRSLASGRPSRTAHTAGGKTLQAARTRLWHLTLARTHAHLQDLPQDDTHAPRAHREHSGDSWHGEEGLLSRLQARAEARLKKDQLAKEDVDSLHSKGGSNTTLVEDDSGEVVPSDSLAAVVCCVLCSLSGLASVVGAGAGAGAGVGVGVGVGMCVCVCARAPNL